MLFRQSESPFDAIEPAPETADPRDVAMFGTKARLDFEPGLAAKGERLWGP